MVWLLRPKERFEPPTKIILGLGVFNNIESLLIFDINSDFEALGVVGKKIPKNKIKKNGIKKIKKTFMNFFIISC